VPGQAPPVVQAFGFGPDFEERVITDLDDIDHFVSKYAVTWINVDGSGDATTITRIGQRFELHPLALEDVVNAYQRAKMEDYQDHVFVTARMPLPCPRLETEQISIFFGRNFVVTFQEQPGGDVLDPVRERIRSARGRIRQAGPDYLAYALVDSVIDSYFPFLEKHGDELDQLEHELLTRPKVAHMVRIHEIKRDLVFMRRIMWNLREAVGLLMRDTTQFVTPETRLHLRDCYDHTVQILDLSDNNRELCTSLLEIYRTGMSARTNEIMKVLTIISTIFIPLTFIVGVYGMNFDPDTSPYNMPELRWYWGYPFALLLMGLVVVGQLLVFARRGWFGSAEVEPRSSTREGSPDPDHPR